MRFRVREVLLVSSPYDHFTLEEDGRINETILLEYKQLSLSSAPRITHVTTAEEALQELRERHYDLVITMSRVGEMLVHVFGNKAKEIQEDIPVVLLAYNTRELALFKKSQGIDIACDTDESRIDFTQVSLEACGCIMARVDSYKNPLNRSSIVR